MGRLILPGGTDVAEMALFDVDALTHRPPDDEALVALERAHAAMRFPTGADGGYLLHAYVDEPVPASVMRYCSTEDAIRAYLRIPRGNLGFGGAESTYADFKPNSAIRMDARITPGDYDVIGYRTEYPEGLIEAAVRAEIGIAGARVLNLPALLIPVTLIGTFIAYFRFGWSAALWIAVLGVIALVTFFRSSYVRQLDNRSRTVQAEFPSIVAHMRRREASDP